MLAAGEKGLGHEVAKRVSSQISAVENGVVDDIEYSLLSYLRELGWYAREFLSESTIRLIKTLCVRLLEQDQAFVISGQPALAAGEDDWQRSHWVREHIATIAVPLGWNDMLEELANSPWYWQDMAANHSSANRENLLFWSLHHCNPTLLAIAANLMEQDAKFQDHMTGAIVWKRLRSRVNVVR